MSKVWFAGGYYIDLDEYGQLRVAGPGNHLFSGLNLPKPFTISNIKQTKNKLKLTITFTASEIRIHDPAMGDVRSVRAVTEIPEQARPTFDDMQRIYPGQFMPTEIILRDGAKNKMTFARKFGEFQYGFELLFPTHAIISKEGQNYKIHNKHPITLTLVYFYDFPDTKLPLKHIMVNGILKNSFDLLPKELQILVERSEEEIGHLLNYSKTSGYEYGTVFPRDWMESAELGVGDLSSNTVQQMYIQALKNLSPEGEGWHEDVIGELATQYKQKGIETIDRRMVDIEPRYILGLERFSAKRLQNNQVLEKFKLVAKFIIAQAKNYDLITFKEPLFGNWRDSYKSVEGATGKIAPYDVNVVFYPAALEKILKFSKILEIDPAEIKTLIKKWKNKRDLFCFKDKRGEPEYAICVFGEKLKQLKVGHTDEAYNLIYGSPSREDCISFAKRLLDPNYFYTNSGPNVVAKHNGFSTTDYHGEVIWPKQTALVIWGLRTQLDRAHNENWTYVERNVLLTALIKTAKNSLKAFIQLDGIPELYIDKEGHATRYDTQTIRNGISSYIQLWSAVGFRRILSDYLYTILKYDQPLEFIE